MKEHVPVGCLKGHTANLLLLLMEKLWAWGHWRGMAHWLAVQNLDVAVPSAFCLFKETLKKGNVKVLL